MLQRCLYLRGQPSLLKEPAPASPLPPLPHIRACLKIEAPNCFRSFWCPLKRKKRDLPTIKLLSRKGTHSTSKAAGGEFLSVRTREPLALPRILRLLRLHHLKRWMDELRADITHGGETEGRKPRDGQNEFRTCKFQQTMVSTMVSHGSMGRLGV